MDNEYEKEFDPTFRAELEMDGMERIELDFEIDF